MTTGTKRFILRFIVGLLTFLIGVAAAMALAGFRPFESNSSGQRNHRQYRQKKSCNFSYRSWNAPLPPAAPSVGHHTGTIHFKGRDAITMTLEK